MTFDDSVRILRRGPRPGADGALEHRLAGVTYSHHNEQRMDCCGRVRFHDAAPNVSGSEPIPYSEQWTGGGQRPGSEVGPTLLQELDGPASAFVILAHGPTGCGLYRVGRADGVGQGMAKSETEDQAARIARLLEGAHDSPKAVRMRDEAWNRRRMREIAAANRKFWGVS
jgi:hypothetical protein